jgi:hypothetical protein
MFAEQSNLAGAGVGSTPEEKMAAFEKARGLAGDTRGALGDMSVAQMRELAGGLRGIEGTGEMREQLFRTAGLGERLQKGGARSAIGALGVSMSKEDVSAFLKKGGTEGLAREVAGQLGGGENKDLIQDLKSMLEDVTGKKGVKGAIKLDSLLGNEEVQKMLQKIQSEKDKTDPNKNLEKIATSMDAMVTQSKHANTHLRSIAASTSKEADSLL